MNKFRLVKAGISVNQGIDRLCGDEELYVDLLLQFLDDTHYEKMLQAIQDRNLDDAFLEAHSLKGITGNVSLTKLYDAIVPLVEELRNGNMDVESYLPAIEEHYQKAIQAISELKESK